MNLVIFGVTLQRDKKVSYALPLLYGIGQARAIQICRELGLPPQLTIGELTELQQFSIAKKIKEDFIVEGNLEEQLKQDLQRYQNNGTQRGYRLRNGLPVRGQRTHSNGKTARRRTYLRLYPLNLWKDRWSSGLRHRSWNPACLYGHHGFESHPICD